ncbi:GRAM domain-containing protein [Alkalibacillus haloalkaliphilus]|uniref:GRAM domain-containing protein n=1 Tax=Alkalibacillus haloalkaliphilus TaxID=94136 RepID=UPI0003139B1F|nr:GRAM domain-containing protein [Alkalibacillus haloalkaliphilus]
MTDCLKEGLANLWKDKEAVGGKLYLTNKELIHKPHKANIQKEDVFIDVQQIVKAEFYTNKVFKVPLMKNGLKVVLDSNETFYFVVNKRNEWKEAIDRLLTCDD